MNTLTVSVSEQIYEKVRAAAGARRRANGCGGTQTDSFGRYYTSEFWMMLDKGFLTFRMILGKGFLTFRMRYGMYSTVSIYHNKTQTSLNNLTWCLMWIVNMNDQAFTDVTLATLDNQHVRAHKIILSSGSTFFKNILVRNLHQNPLIYLTKIFLNKVLPELSIILCALTCWLSNMARVTSVKAWSFTFTIHTKHHVKLFRDVCVLLWYMKTVLYIPYLWQIFSPL